MFFVFVSKNLGLLSPLLSPSPPERCGEEAMGTVRGVEVRNQKARGTWKMDAKHSFEKEKENKLPIKLKG